MEDEVVRNAMVASDKSRKEGTKEVPTVILDPPQVGGVNSAPIRRNSDSDTGGPNKEIILHRFYAVL